MKCTITLLCLAFAIVSSDAHFSLFHKFHKTPAVLELPVHLKPIHVQPVLIQPPKIEQPTTITTVTTPAPVKPTNKSWQIHEVWANVKNTAVEHNPLKLFHKKKTIVAVPAPELTVWPSLGFSHYKKIHYIPVYPVHEQGQEEVHPVVISEPSPVTPKEQIYVQHEEPVVVDNSHYPAPSFIPYPPVTSYGTPASNYALPESSNSVPATSYSVPATSYSAPESSYGVPSSSSL